MIKIIKTLTLALFFTLPFGQLTRLPQLPPGVNLYLFDLIIALILFFYLFTKPKNRPKLGIPIFLFIATAILSLVLNTTHFSTREIFISSLYLVRFTAYSGLYFVLSDKRINLKTKDLLIYSSLALGIFGLVQYLSLPDTRFLSTLQWDDHYYRVISTLGDPSFVGIILVLGLILLFFTKKAWYFYPFYLLPLFLTYSRSSYLSLLTAGLAITIIKKKFKYLLAIVFLFILTLPLLPQPGGEGVNLKRLYSIYQRGDSWKESINIIKKQPIFGVGFNTLRYYRRNTNTAGAKWQLSHAASGLDSSLLFVFATTGIIGFVAYLNLLIKSFKLSNLLKVSLVALLTHSLFQNSLFYPHIMIWFWVLLA